MKRTIKATGALLLLLCGAALAEPAPATGKVVTYLFDVFHGKQAMMRALSEQRHDEPELQALMTSAIGKFDLDALAARLEGPLSRTLSAEDTAQCLALISSEGGATLMETSRKASSQEDLIKQLERLPAPQQAAVLTLFNAPCIQKTVAYISSAEAKQISFDYGKSLVCDYMAEHDPAKLELLKQQGECK